MAPSSSGLLLASVVTGALRHRLNSTYGWEANQMDKCSCTSYLFDGQKYGPLIWSLRPLNGILGTLQAT